MKILTNRANHWSTGVLIVAGTILNLQIYLNYRKYSKISDTQKIVGNHPKIRTRYHRVMDPKES